MTGTGRMPEPHWLAGQSGGLVPAIAPGTSAQSRPMRAAAVVFRESVEPGLSLQTRVLCAWSQTDLLLTIFPEAARLWRMNSVIISAATMSIAATHPVSTRIIHTHPAR